MNEPVIQLNPDRYEPVLTKTAIFYLNFLILWPLALIFGGLGLIWTGTEVESSFYQGALICFGMACIIVGCIRGLFFSGKESDDYLQRRARNLFMHRNDSVIDPWDKECVFVEVVPRKNLVQPSSQTMMEDASDLGFVKVDLERKLLLFEGGVERWFVAGEDIVHCQYERVFLGPLPRYFVVLRMKHPEDDVAAIERMISPRYSRGLGLLGNRSRRQRAEKVIEDIKKISRVIEAPLYTG